MSVTDLRRICIETFPASKNRAPLLDALLVLLNDLASLAAPCTLWIDGSFLTEKPEPEDIDLSVCFDLSVFERFPENLQQVLNERLNGKTYHPLLDTYLLVSATRDHPMSDIYRQVEEYWIGWWSVSRGNWLKGIADIRVGETDVGLRVLP
jgi:hypothetical protein